MARRSSSRGVVILSSITLSIICLYNLKVITHLEFLKPGESQEETPTGITRGIPKEGVSQGNHKGQGNNVLNLVKTKESIQENIQSVILNTNVDKNKTLKDGHEKNQPNTKVLPPVDNRTTLLPPVDYNRLFRNLKAQNMDNKTFLRHYEASCHQREQLYRNRKRTQLPLCPCLPPGLVGSIQVDPKTPADLDLVSRDHPNLPPGGEWRPQACEARDHVAIIIPYRDRSKHLAVLLKHLHPLLQRQQIHYRIFLVEQHSPVIFNKGALMNSGFLELFGDSKSGDVTESRGMSGGGGKYGSWDCVIFHDVDTIPQHDWNFYTCAHSPRHVGAYLSYLKYMIPYGFAYGGVTLLAPQEFRQCNGFTSEFFGWGGEDDDMYHRVTDYARLKIQRFPSSVARYVKLLHGRDRGNPPNPRGGLGLKARKDHYATEGLSTVKYIVKESKNMPLYTWLHISITHPVYQPPNSTKSAKTKT